ncbi:MAG TPA: DNA polymerase [Phycisphaerae bacterium]|nr:DNA polymerase [Phycisphaerae bacterium]
MVNILFVDMNAYFASVEQQLRPELRHKPVGIVAAMTDHTSCIAASYEAKALGIKTGTAVWEAKHMCRDIQIVEARPLVYVQMHHAIIAAIEDCLHVDAVLSIDEMACRLLGKECIVDNAVAIAQKVKKKIKTDIGEYLRCSIGLAPNRFLAKVAADMHKPDGLTVITPEDIPHKLFNLALDDFPGIGNQMLLRFSKAGVYTVEQMYALSERQLRDIWHSVLGERWWYWLRGRELAEPPHHRRTVGHSHVLPPHLRNDRDTKSVMVRLIHKAAARLRHLRYWAQRLSIFVELVQIGGWEANGSLGTCQDTISMLELFERLWSKKPAGKAMQVGVTLYQLIPEASATMPLFTQSANRVKLCKAMDKLNARFGANTVYFGETHNVLDSAPTRIAFTQIPDLNLYL